MSAKKSTPCNSSLAIILLSALFPAPPTPTTTILGANSCNGGMPISVGGGVRKLRGVAAAAAVVVVVVVVCDWSTDDDDASGGDGSLSSVVALSLGFGAWKTSGGGLIVGVSFSIKVVFESSSPSSLTALMFLGFAELSIALSALSFKSELPVAMYRIDWYGATVLSRTNDEAEDDKIRNILEQDSKLGCACSRLTERNFNILILD